MLSSHSLDGVAFSPVIAVLEHRNVLYTASTLKGRNGWRKDYHPQLKEFLEMLQSSHEAWHRYFSCCAEIQVINELVWSIGRLPSSYEATICSIDARGRLQTINPCAASSGPQRFIGCETVCKKLRIQTLY